MNPPRILLVGKTGQVGWELRRALAPLGPVQAVDYPEVDLADADSIRRCVRAAAPRLIVNAAAYTAVDKAETESEQAMRINGVAPGILAREAQAAGAQMLHYSTDYVFDGRKTEPYVETDSPAPQNAYGVTKLAGEQAVQAAGGSYLIFRLCWVYGTRGQNFMRTIQRLARERETLRIVSDQVGSPTWSRLVAEATALALERVLAAPNAAAFNGLYHLSAGGLTSWHGFAEAIVNLMPAAERKCQRVQAITTPEYPLPAKRPAYSGLGCDKLKTTFGLQLPDWQDGLHLALDCV